MIRRPLPLIAAMVLLTTAAYGQGVSEMRLDRIRESLTGTHRHYRQFIDGIEVVGGERAETLLPEGAVRVDFDRSARPGGQRSEVAGRTLSMAVPSSVASDLVYVNVDGEAHLARRVIVETRRLEPHARYFDASTGALLRDDPLFYTAKQGRVFDVNPVAKLNAPQLKDDNDSAAAVPAAAYSEVDLPGLNPTGTLAGPNVQIVDLEAPFTARADASQSLDFDRSQPQFEEVNAYFQIDRAQRYLQSLGYTGSRQLVAYAIPVDAHAANGTDNSYYIEGTPVGHGTLYFGDGGTEDAEDSDIMLHEFGHAIHDWIIPGALTGASSSQARAVSEGFGDYWSFSSTYALTIPSGRDPFCIADWDARCGGDDASKQCGYSVGADCLRRVDSTKTVTDYINSDNPGTEHKNGMIWSSALREIFMNLVQRYGLDQGKRVSDTIALESLFGLPPSPDFRTVAASMIAADRQLRGGEEVDAICSAMTARGVFSAGDCGNIPRGESTLFQSPDHQVAIPDGTGSITSTLTINDTRAIAKLAVRVDIAHSSRGDLVISLTAPNGTTVKLKDSSQTDRTPDVHATFGLDAPSVESLSIFNGQPANGTWKLVVSDIYTGDTGALQDWDLRVAFEGDAPAVFRPDTGMPRRFIPAVAHANGASGSYASDVYLLNRGARDAVILLIYTPSGANGSTQFAASKVSVAAGQSIALRDIVNGTFASKGIGSLEIEGDPANVITTSITRNTTAAGDFSQRIPAMEPSRSIGASDRAVIALPVVTNAFARTNGGAVETRGGSGIVRVTVLRAGGEIAGSTDVPIAPFGHFQMPLAANDAWCLASFSVVTGDARIIAYESLIDARSGDATFFPAEPPIAVPTTFTLPIAGHAAGIGGAVWDVAAWYADPFPSTAVPAQLTYLPSGSAASAPHPFGPAVRTPALVSEVFGRSDNTIGQVDVTVPAGALFAARAASDLAGAMVGDRIESITPDVVADIVGIESSAAFRTNIGVSALDDQTTTVRVTLFDASGRSLASTTWQLPPRGTIQVPLASIYGSPVSTADVRVEATSGGRIAAWASVISNATQDPAWIAGQ